MKKLLLLLFPAIVFAQSNFKELDSLGFKNQIETVLNDTGKKFEFYKFKDESGSKILIYKNVLDETDKVNIFYSTYMKGENKNLEINGVETWRFKSIIAKYLTIFPIWKKYGDIIAVEDQLAKSGFKMKGDYSIREVDAPYWMMRF